MNRSFMVREWGAVTFVLTVALGAIIVPLALLLGHRAPAANAGSVPPPVVTASPSASPSGSPSPSASPTPSTPPSPSTSPSP